VLIMVRSQLDDLAMKGEYIQTNTEIYIQGTNPPGYYDRNRPQPVKLLYLQQIFEHLRLTLS